MPLVPFQQLMAHAEEGRYAVGYFESWNLESLLAVADAAEAARSPVILGFSGIYLTHPQRAVREPLSAYAALGLEVCRKLSIPAGLLFNESPAFEAVLEAVDVGFNLVMYSDDAPSDVALAARVRQVCTKAHASGAAVEAELAALPGVGGDLMQRANDSQPADLRLTNPAEARRFVEETSIDALAVNIGQVHLHGRETAPLDFARLDELRAAVRVPLVLHGASSITERELAEAVRRGIRKINVGSALKQAYFGALRDATASAASDANPYEIIGSGLAGDVLVAGRLAMKRRVGELMHVFGSAGKAQS